MRELVEDANLGEREAAAEMGVAEHANAPRVKSVERADRFGPIVSFLWHGDVSPALAAQPLRTPSVFTIDRNYFPTYRVRLGQLMLCVRGSSLKTSLRSLCLAIELLQQ